MDETSDGAGVSSGAARPVALVTGATRGIGLAIARELGSTHRVLVGGRDAAATAAVARELPDGVPFPVELTDGSSVAEAVARAGLDRLDALVHSAGIVGVHGPVADVDRAAYREAFEVNVVAVADLTRFLLPPLRAARGVVVIINSGSGLTSGPGQSVYTASKFAARALADSIREEERSAGVRVTSIHPGRVDTDMQQELRRAEGGPYEAERYLDPVSVADAVRLAVSMPPGAAVESLSVRPIG